MILGEHQRRSHDQTHSESRTLFSVSQEEASRVDRLAETVGITQGLRLYFNPILNVILQSLDAPPVFMRTKALKALGQILSSDPTILGQVRKNNCFLSSFISRASMLQENVRRAIESHLLDSSPAVRDAAVELIGKYVVESPHLAGNYYNQIAERIAVRSPPSCPCCRSYRHRILDWEFGSES